MKHNIDTPIFCRIFGEISQKHLDQICSIVQENTWGGRLTIKINSSGGSIVIMNAIMNELLAWKNLNKETYLIIEVLCEVSSSALFLLSLADAVYLMPGSFAYVHDVHHSIRGGDISVLSWINVIDNIRQIVTDRLLSKITEDTEKREDFVNSLCSPGVYYSREQLLETFPTWKCINFTENGEQ